MFGGRAISAAAVTWTLVAINVLLWLVELVDSNLGYDWAMLGLGRGSSGGLIGVAAGQWYRLITAAFLPPPGLGNFGPLDIIFNMYALILVGPALERALGHWRYLSVYLFSALGGSVLFFYLRPFESALGASGAIFGLFGAWFVLARKLRVDSRQVVILIVLNLVFGFVVPGIAWQAHVGGLIAGSLLTAAYVYAPRSNRTLLQAGATVAMLAIVVIAVVIRDQQLLGVVRL
ncbi:MAG: rhomboid family intramembrane serine protease [Streptosporangiaceae bacterium]|jgi:membrane associated rhomboid family serine protease